MEVLCRIIWTYVNAVMPTCICDSFTVFPKIVALSFLMSRIAPAFLSEVLLRSGMFSETISASILQSFDAMVTGMMAFFIAVTFLPSPNLNDVLDVRISICASLCGVRVSTKLLNQVTPATVFVHAVSCFCYKYLMLVKFLSH